MFDKAWPSFFGAFFAFLFTQIALFLGAVIKRRRDGHNALVGIERICTEYSNQVSSNRIALSVFSGFAESAKRKEPVVIFNRLFPFEIYREASMDLMDMNLVNRFEALTYAMHCWNQSIETTHKMYDAAVSKLLDNADGVDQKYLEITPVRGKTTGNPSPVVE